jgi:hypothetical protein
LWGPVGQRGAPDLSSIINDRETAQASVEKLRSRVINTVFPDMVRRSRWKCSGSTSRRQRHRTLREGLDKPPTGSDARHARRAGQSQRWRISRCRRRDLVRALISITRVHITPVYFNQALRQHRYPFTTGTYLLQLRPIRHQTISALDQAHQLVAEAGRWCPVHHVMVHTDRQVQELADRDASVDDPRFLGDPP